MTIDEFKRISKAVRLMQSPYANQSSVVAKNDVIQLLQVFVDDEGEEDVQETDSD